MELPVHQVWGDHPHPDLPWVWVDQVWGVWEVRLPDLRDPWEDPHAHRVHRNPVTVHLRVHSRDTVLHQAHRVLLLRVHPNPITVHLRVHHSRVTVHHQVLLLRVHPNPITVHLRVHHSRVTVHHQDQRVHPNPLMVHLRVHHLRVRKDTLHRVHPKGYVVHRHPVLHLGVEGSVVHRLPVRRKDMVRLPVHHPGGLVHAVHPVHLRVGVLPVLHHHRADENKWDHASRNGSLILENVKREPDRKEHGVNN
mmetsp:Transcript_1913/g.2040  ORF Transcript_1913/g.2040 Transcript_1913/m.2040 type:complete len:251 (-) Transcript_1913:302-1054(-)